MAACCRNSLPGGGGRALAEKAVCTAGQQPGPCVCSQLESRLGHCISQGPPPKPRTRARPEHALSGRPQVTGSALLQTTPGSSCVFTSGPGHTGLQEQEQLPCHPSRSLRALDPRGTGLMSPAQDTPLPSPSPKLCPCRPGRAMGSTVPAHRKSCSTHPCRAAPLSSLQRERGPAVTPRGDQSGGVWVVETWVRSAQTRVCGLQRLPALHAWENP